MKNYTEKSLYNFSYIKEPANIELYKNALICYGNISIISLYFPYNKKQEEELMNYFLYNSIS